VRRFAAGAHVRHTRYAAPAVLVASRAPMGVAGATPTFMGGSVLGLILGGFMLSWFWWGPVFLLAVSGDGAPAGPRPLLLPEYRNSDAGRLDLFSVRLSLMAVIPFIYGIKETARSGWAPGPVVALSVRSSACCSCAGQRHLADPMPDLGLFKIHIYRSALVLGLLLGIVQGGTLLLINLQLQTVERLVGAPCLAGCTESD
jgi:MFS transporter, DHA2 family, multidrug resistance protein